MNYRTRAENHGITIAAVVERREDKCSISRSVEGHKSTKLPERS